MFKFNFQTESSCFEKKSNTLAENETETFKEYSNAKYEEIDPSNINEYCYKFERVSVDDYIVYIRNFDEEENNEIEGEDTRLSFVSKYYKTYDVVPSVYEGGLKIWECTYDLIRYLLNEKTDFNAKNVLDLGCGAGMLGIYAAQRNARLVHFHDYNADVLKNFTIPNVKTNEIKTEVKFISGDWDSFLEALPNTCYDYILTSETLYNTENYSKLSKIFAKKLNRNGQIFIASKSYYFGVGGGTELFQLVLDKEKKFQWNVVWKFTTGVRREIVCLEKLCSET